MNLNIWWKRLNFEADLKYGVLKWNWEMGFFFFLWEYYGLWIIGEVFKKNGKNKEGGREREGGDLWKVIKRKRREFRFFGCVKRKQLN